MTSGDYINPDEPVVLSVPSPECYVANERMKMDFDSWMLTKNPKYCPTDDTVALRMLRECWHAAQVFGSNDAMRDVFPQAHRLALELECLLLSCTDTAATAKWWDSANEALEQWREFCREDSTHNAELRGRPLADGPA